MIMAIKYPETGGACPVNVEVTRTDIYLVIEWAGAQLCLPVEDIMGVLMEDDGK